MLSEESHGLGSKRRLTTARQRTTSHFVTTAGYYYFSFGFWAYFTPKPTGGCREI